MWSFCFIRHQSGTNLMDFDESLLAKILYSDPDWSVDVQGKRFVPDSVDIDKFMVPVKRPDTRGGVYFSETEAYRVRCLVGDRSIMSVLTSTMLGPNADFVPIRITATSSHSSSSATDGDGGSFKHVIVANLTNYVQTKGAILLNLVVTGIDDV